jgi:hypothetical protein
VGARFVKLGELGLIELEVRIKEEKRRKSVGKRRVGLETTGEELKSGALQGPLLAFQ